MGKRAIRVLELTSDANRIRHLGADSTRTRHRVAKGFRRSHVPIMRMRMDKSPAAGKLRINKSAGPASRNRRHDRIQAQPILLPSP